MPFTRPEIEKVYGGHFISGNSVELLRDGETFQNIFDTIKAAQELICLEFYIYRNDETGTRLAELLKDKSKEGIRVFILYDHLGSFGTPRAFWKDLQKAGISVRASHPFKWTAPGGYQHRDHRKLIVVDGKTAITGGLNIANEYGGFHLRKKLPWRDTGIIIKGPAAYVLLETFKNAWDTWKGKPIFFNPPQEVEGGGLSVMPIFAHSARGRRRLRRLLYYGINHASEDICITTAYFTPSWKLIETIENAAKRGVRVRILVPGTSDILAAYYAGRAFFGRLLRAGVEIYTYTGRVLHAKSYVFDCLWSIVGSANLDFQSLRWNDEGNVGILDRDFATEMAEMFDKDIAHSKRIDREEWARRPLSEKLLEWFFSFFRRRL